MKIALPTLLFVSLAFACASAQASPELDEMLKPCAACHGVDGTGATPKTPHLNWQIPGYLSGVMEGMQAGTHPTVVPKHIPASMSKDQIAKIAEHYGASRAPRSKQPVDETKLADGEKIYGSRCADCHSDNGRESNDRGSPILANQPAEYLLSQERLYMSGKRKFSFKADTAHAGMTDSDLVAISHFFASQDVVPPKKTKKKRL